MKVKPSYNYEFPRPAVTTDCVIFGFDGGELKLLLIKREKEPFKNEWALPGGFVHENESINNCALRILHEKTGLKNLFIEQLYTFGTGNRDPRGHIISVCYFALVNKQQYKLIAGRDTLNAEWFALSELPALAFDHAEMVYMATHRLKNKVRYAPIGFELLNERFTISELHSLYEAILGRTIDRRNFHKKITAMGFLTDLGEKERNVAHKPAAYYSFNQKAYEVLEQKGFNFEI